MNEAPLIAIVDDDESVRRSLHRLVQSAGYVVETFGSAAEFLAWLPRGRAACLVLDVHMDEMSGFELEERLAVPSSSSRRTTTPRPAPGSRNPAPSVTCGSRSTRPRCSA